MSNHIETDKTIRRVGARKRHSTGRKGIPREIAYQVGIFPHEYDLEAMLIAFGRHRIEADIEEICACILKGKRFERRKNK